ncbi:hypothetical protein Pogu_1861 [Pyrobaculum oguniense TE7]|uniref:Uncharacterized protein n=1 Tax=Pyrobaculum oguniense (strain DSM 13380 / JCM 10595 / TE7) TaxID=698757 RepID=H6QAW5_PYROT|nr:hypothetical protein Pogu_1861 [Pyrobaculum oguniense TE7]
MTFIMEVSKHKGHGKFEEKCLTLKHNEAKL